MPSENTESAHLIGGIVLSVIASILLGLGPSLAKLAFDGGADDISLQGLRFGLGALFVWPFLKFRGLSIAPLRTMWRRVLIMGTFTATGAFGYMGSTRYIDVPLSSLIFFAYPLIIGVIAWLCRTESMDSRKASAVLVGFIGVGMTVGFATGSPDWLGIALAMLGAITVAVIFVISVPALHASSAPAVLFCNSVVAACIFAIGASLAPLADYVPQLPHTSLGWTGLGLHIAVMTTGIGLLLASIARIGAVRATVVNNVEPPISALAAAVLFSQFLDGLQWLGGALIIGAIVILQVRKKISPQVPAAVDAREF